MRGDTLRRLIGDLGAKTDAQVGRRMLAPVVRGGAVRARIDGLVCTLRVTPEGYEGWGVFEITSPTTARLVEPAGFLEVERYLEPLPSLRLWLARPLGGLSWLAVAANASDARQRYGLTRPVIVRLVHEGRQLERVIARWDGATWWAHELDLRPDPAHIEALRDALSQHTPPERLRLSGLTPEHRRAYALAHHHGHLAALEHAAREADRRAQADAHRLRRALAQAGGVLDDFEDRGDLWLVRWHTEGDEHHESAIAKHDLTVLSAGICLSGEDEVFDLQALVGVVEGADFW